MIEKKVDQSGPAADTHAGSSASDAVASAARPSRFTPKQRKWFKRSVMAGGIFTVVYTLFGFFGVPAFTRWVIEDKITKYLNGQASLNETTFNPYTFRFTLTGLSITDDTQNPVLAVDSFDANFSLWNTIFKPGIQFQHVLIGGPDLRLARTETSSINVLDLFPPPTGEPYQLKKIPRLVAQQFAVTDAGFGLEDRALETPFTAEIQDLNANVGGLDLAPDYENPLSLTLTSDLGATVDITAAIFADPLTLEGDVMLTGLLLERIQPYVSTLSTAVIESGTVDAEVGFRFAPVDEANPAIADIRTARLSELKITNDEQPVLTVAAVDLASIRADIGKRHVDLGGITVSGVTAAADRDPDGVLSMTKLLRPEARQALLASSRHTETDDAPINLAAINYPLEKLTAAVKKLQRELLGPWSLAAQPVVLENISASAADHAVSPAALVEITSFGGTIGPVYSEQDFKIPIDLSGRLNTEGAFHLQGELLPIQGRATIQADTANIPVSLIAGYLPQAIGPLEQALITEGKAHTQGVLNAEWLSGEGLFARWSGEADLSGINLEAANDRGIQVASVQTQGQTEARVLGPQQIQAEWSGQVTVEDLTARAAVISETANSAVSWDTLTVSGKATLSPATDTPLTNAHTAAWYGELELTGLTANSHDDLPVLLDEGVINPALWTALPSGLPSHQVLGQAQMDQLLVNATQAQPAQATVSLDRSVDATWQGIVRLASPAVLAAQHSPSQENAFPDERSLAIQFGASEITLDQREKPVRLQLDRRGQLIIGLGGNNALAYAYAKVAEQRGQAGENTQPIQAGIRLGTLESGVNAELTQSQAAGWRADWAGETRLQRVEISTDLDDLNANLAVEEIAIALAERENTASLNPEGKLLASAKKRVNLDGIQVTSTKPGLLDELSIAVGSLALNAAADAHTGDTLHASFTAGLDIADVETEGRSGQTKLQEVVDAVALSGITWSHHERQLVVDNIAVHAPVTHLEHPLTGGADTEETSDPAPKTPETPATPTDRPAETARAIRDLIDYEVIIRQIRIDDGRAELVDSGFETPQPIQVKDIDITVKDISLQSTEPAQASIDAAVADTGRVAIQAEVDPFGRFPQVKGSYEMDGVVLTHFSPWVEYYLGYRVDRGSGKATADYALNENKDLDIGVDFSLGDFYVGDKVESPVAPNLPVPLGLEILRNRQGAVAADLPGVVHGNLSDPNLRVDLVILAAIGNLIEKALAAPFDLIAGPFASGDEPVDYSQLLFTAGQPKPVSLEEGQKLASLAQGMNEKAGLTLVVVGLFDPATDAKAIADAANADYEKQVAAYEAEAWALIQQAMPSATQASAATQPAAEAASDADASAATTAAPKEDGQALVASTDRGDETTIETPTRSRNASRLSGGRIRKYTRGLRRTEPTAAQESEAAATAATQTTTAADPSSSPEQIMATSGQQDTEASTSVQATASTEPLDLKTAAAQAGVQLPPPPSQPEPPTQTQLIALAQARAEWVADKLAQQHGLPADRFAIAASEKILALSQQAVETADAQKPGTAVRFEIK